jgi:uncharacterized protein DUF4157
MSRTHLHAEHRKPTETPPRVAGRRVHPFSGLHASAGNRAIGRLSQRPPNDAGGQPLRGSLRRSLEAAYRTDLGGVRLHTDDAAADAARGLGARAFTLGNQIWFGRGEYRPQRPQGQYLLAHEVAHTVQQRGQIGAVQRSALVGSVDDPAEALADRAAEAAMRGEAVPSVGSSDAVIRRYTITRAEPVVEGGETVVYVDLDTGVRYRVRRVRDVHWEEGRPGSSYFPPTVTPGYDANDVWVDVSWCRGTEGSVAVGADVLAEIRNIMNRLLTAASTRGSGTAALSASELTPFVDFAVAQSGGVSVSGGVHVTVGRSGATGGGGGLKLDWGEWTGELTLETGPGGTTGGVKVTWTPGRQSRTFRCPTRDQVTGRWVPTTSYECTRESTPPPAEPAPTPGPEMVSLYFVYSHDTIREDASRAELERLRGLLGRGFRATRIEGFTSPEGPLERLGRFEGNTELGKERAQAATERVRSLGGEVTVKPAGKGELYTEASEGKRLAAHAVPLFMGDAGEMARLTPEDRAQLAAAQTPTAQAAIIYPYLRRAVITLEPRAHAAGALTVPRAPLDLSLHRDCPLDVLDRAKPLFDRSPPGRGTP